ncbi:kinase-like domain-containing protein [Xylaria digitata]|nr:kinase-like domain-containing protein [Xylaria digitata]
MPLLEEYTDVLPPTPSLPPSSSPSLRPSTPSQLTLSPSPFSLSSPSQFQPPSPISVVSPSPSSSLLSSSTLSDGDTESSAPRHQEPQEIPSSLVLSRQQGAEVVLHCGGVLKSGHRVKHNEEAALRLVKQFTTIPVPQVYGSEYKFVDDHPWGQIWMEYLQGVPLSHKWDFLDNYTKSRLCHEIWDFTKQLRAIPKPPEFQHLSQCGADGSACESDFLQNMTQLDDDYGAWDGWTVWDELPRSGRCVFTHADLAPRNILVDENNVITGVLDWEFAGWHPDHWEYTRTQMQWAAIDFDLWMYRTISLDWLIGACLERSPGG